MPSPPRASSVTRLTLRVREAGLADRDAIRSIHRAAFGRDDEATLVDRLVDARDAIVSLVAVDAGDTIGHVLFSRLRVTTANGDELTAAALAPLAVVPHHQRRGAGEALVREGLDRVAARNIEVVIVLGDPAYYGRFGFSADHARMLRGPFTGPSWMALEIVPDALRDVSATVVYPSAFGIG